MANQRAKKLILTEDENQLFECVDPKSNEINHRLAQLEQVLESKLGHGPKQRTSAETSILNQIERLEVLVYSIGKESVFSTKCTPDISLAGSVHLPRGSCESYNTDASCYLPAEELHRLLYSPKRRRQILAESESLRFPDSNEIMIVALEHKAVHYGKIALEMKQKYKQVSSVLKCIRKHKAN